MTAHGGAQHDAPTPPVELRGPELRAAERFSPVMRTAKVLCGHTEYICLVRNISATGTALRFFHKPPRDETLWLEMANGYRAEIQCLWRDGDQAGYQFSNPIEIADLLDAPGIHSRPDIRIKLGVSGAISANGIVSWATILDLSQTGARIETDASMAVRQLVYMTIDGLTPRVGHVRWRDGQAHGLVFQQSLGLVELARLVHEVGPFTAAPVTRINPRKTGFARCA